MKLSFRTDKPSKFSSRELADFLALLIKQNQVADPSIEKINKCHFLSISYHEAIPVGIGAIKDIYKTPFTKAGIPEMADKYKAELGYIYILDDEAYREKGIGKSICKDLLDKVITDNVFATTEVNDNNAMKFILEKLGFKQSGKIYKGSKTGKEIGLFLFSGKKTP